MATRKDDVHKAKKKLFTITGQLVKLPGVSKFRSSSTAKPTEAPAEAPGDKPADEAAVAPADVTVEPAPDQTEEIKRGNWSSKYDFILSSVGYAVGLGNVWRFPYLCYINGGGAFLIPYCIMLLAAGLPMFVAELGFGQFASKGCISIWDASPLFRGLGYSMCIISAMVAVYYNVVITYTVFYFFSSFTTALPWSDCSQTWNTPNCTVAKSNGTAATAFNPNTSTRPSQEYWDYQCLGRTEGLENLGPIRWQLALCLLFAWFVVGSCIVRGVKSSGKVVYFTATFPYIVLIILLFRGATLPGSLQGVIFYINPKFEKLLNPAVWKDAAVQIFYSLGPAWGGLHTLASYNKFDNNFKRDGIMIAFINCGTSIFAGFVIFSVIGFMSYDSGLPIEVVADTGPGLAFVVYPEALARMPAAPVWSVLFFFMLFTLGLDSEFVIMETLITAFCDEMKYYFKDVLKWKTLITISFCLVNFLLGLPMCTGGGIYILTLMDNYTAGFSLLIVAFTECIVISYVYGIKAFIKDLSVMVPSGLGLYWRICLQFVSPLILLAVFVSFCITYSTLEYSGYVYPPGGEALGWLMVIAGVIAIPVYAIYLLLRSPLGFSVEGLREAMRPSRDWGPAAAKDRIRAGYPLLDVHMDGYPPKSSLAVSSPGSPDYSVDAIYVHHETCI